MTIAHKVLRTKKNVNFTIGILELSCSHSLNKFQYEAYYYLELVLNDTSVHPH